MAMSKAPRELSVFLVESMNANDIYRGWLEGEAIVQVLRLLGVKARYKTVIDRE